MLAGATLCAAPLFSSVCAHADSTPGEIDVSKSCDGRNDTVVCFAQSTVQAFDFCGTFSSLAIDGARKEAELRRLRDLPPTDATLNLWCIDDGVKTAERIYSRALASAKSKATMVKDYYANWRASMRGIRPELAETMVAYRLRQTQAGRELRVMAERLQLE